MNRKTLKDTVATLSFITLATGCGLITRVVAPNSLADITSINGAVDRKDEAYLEKVCSGDSPARAESDQKYACHQLERLQGPQKALAAATCDNVIEKYEGAPKDKHEFVVSMGKKMAECGHYAYLFEHVVHWGDNKDGAKLMSELESSGKSMDAEFAKYLASHKGPQFFPVKDDRKNDVSYGLDHITNWLIDKGHTQHCAALAASATGANIVARVSVMNYFATANCKEGIPLATELLLADLPGDRTLGCNVLGKIGDVSVLEKVKVVADTDGYSTVKEEERNGRVWATKVYPVRDACLQASGKIKLRK